MFQEGNRVEQWSSYDDLADKILADDEVSRAETEQAIRAKAQCMQENGLSGTISYDLDVYPWTHGGSYGPSESVYPPATDEQMNDDALFDAYFAKGEAITKERLAKCAAFDRVEQWVVSHADWEAYSRKHYEARVQCIRTNAKSYADRINPSWPADSDGMRQLNETFMPLLTQGGSGADFEGLKGCMMNAGGVTIPFGDEATAD
ncbi:hypothetical protein [Bifidobacterium avesanii]|uniref:Uncharacterized protein n=1 Tax=Bifidobacterium avesanii TaxID=1798157 RepID=A0A7K3THR9_9BIFI|nr:hypothetical protein [Bifidobacterium avesanii]NEG78635.1 hypothetical protein [Bifidobacterium avesanii]